MRGSLGCFCGSIMRVSSSQWYAVYCSGKLSQYSRGITTNVAKEARVFSFGDGSHGALGHTDCFGGDVYEPQEVEGLPPHIVSVGVGHYHSMAVSQAGDLWAWGRNLEGQLGQRDNDFRATSHQPQRVRGLESIKVKSAAGSGVVSMAIATDGSLWAWGTSKRGQLGLGPNITHSLTPQRVEALTGQEVVQVALGWGHALACTAEGHLYSWGYAADGRLGVQPDHFSSKGNLSEESRTPDSEHQIGGDIQEIADRKVAEDMNREKSPVLAWDPIRVNALSSQRVIKIACGFDHSLALDDQGFVWSFGDNSLGQLGRVSLSSSLQSSDFSQQYPVHCVEGALTGRGVLRLGAGLGHSLAVDMTGSVYSWGWNAGSQLGRDGCCDNPLPANIQDLKGEEVLDLTGGRVHSLAVTSKGEVWVWGSGKNGRLGIGSTADEPAPFLVESLVGLPVVQAICGYDHSLVLVAS